MVTSLKVNAGKFYVNHSRKIIREVVMVKDQTVVFLTHHLDTGNSCGSASECNILDFLQWAHHEASPAEMTSLLYRKKEILIGAGPFSKRKTVEAESQVDRL
jgi:hypothetical protein